MQTLDNQADDVVREAVATLQENARIRGRNEMRKRVRTLIREKYMGDAPISLIDQLLDLVEDDENYKVRS